MIGQLPEADVDLFETALLLGALDAPGVDLDTCHRHMEAMIVRARTSSSGATALDGQAETLTRTLHEDAGYDGDRQTYNHPDNANLIRVIERRRGLPVAIGLLYIHLGEALGWRVRGLDVPGHFVVRVEADGNRLILDPFHGGAVLDVPSLRRLLKQAVGPSAELSPQRFLEMSKRDVLLRLQNNIKSRALTERRIERAAEIVARMTLFAPALAALWFERGVLEDQMDHLSAAASAFSTCLERSDDPRLRESASAALNRLNRRLN